MDSTTETPTTSENPAVEEADDQGRNFPGRVRGQRLEITAADLSMYSAITGRRPSEGERDRALTWSEGDPLKDQIADIVGTSSESNHARPWSLSTRIRDMWFNGVTIKVHKPHFTDWFRKLSTAIHQGRQRVKKAG